ncbi:phosphotransferase [Polaribacter cellanae]|uniref:Phosphotransferase n=1 Tax=Polaribacter cellanae TaxID=2818493 RepID=A0A975CL39_9FLAO|nr:phosphotransferase [Polaribacter cellanae]QTE21304.1 phosphotransferase [Polaribacter cellanae]
MRQYSDLHSTEIKEIIAAYTNNDVVSYKLLSGGSENTNYLVKLTKETYVLTICEQKSIHEAQELVYLLNYLNQHHFSTSKPIKTKTNEPILIWKGKTVILKEYLSGFIAENLPNNLLIEAGEQLGKLHKIKAPHFIRKDISYGIEYFKEIEAYAANSPFQFWLKNIKTSVEKHIALNLPKSLIHSDLFYSNLIINEHKTAVTIMDFEEASFYYRVFDIGMAIVGLCQEEEKINVNKAKYLLKGYKKEVNLLAIEKESLKDFTAYAAAGTAFWRHKHFNYIQPEKKMFKHYLQMKNIADYTNELSNDFFKKSLNL